MKGCIVDSSYIIDNNETIVHLFGKLENGQSFIALKKIEPYFFIKKSDAKKVEKYLQKYKVVEADLVNFQNEKVVKIAAAVPAEINSLVSFLHKSNIETYEADIKPAMRFIIDEDIFATINIDGEYSSSEKVDRIYHNPEITAEFYQPNLKILSMDIESSKESGDLFCIGIYGENYQKNFMVTKEKLKNTVSCLTEADCLEKFRAELIKQDPDIIIGWNVIDFDLVYLKNLFKKHSICFDLGRNSENVRMRIESNFFRSSSVDMPGRQVLDGINLIKDPFIKEAPSIKNADFDSYSLEDVAQAILKTGKLIKGSGRHEEIEKLYKKNPQKIVDYNLMDCKLAYDIIKETKIIELVLERSQLTSLPFNRVTSSIAAFDSLYIREARKLGTVSPTTIYKEKEERIKGGYVKSPEPGIYHNVLVLDFKSLYPSIIKTFNIDPASFIVKKEKDSIEAPNGALFKNKTGILPEIIERLHQAREKAKKEKRELASYAIKIIMNSFFGVLASPNCRYFNLDIANSITHFGQMLIKLTAVEIEKKGYKVIYSDTDSVFVETKLEKEKANILGEKIENEINIFYSKFVKEKYGRNSLLELQFQKQYLSLMIPKIRDKEKEKAAKKRYAGLIEKENKEILEIVGLEAIRGDWTEAAQDFQKEILVKVFHREPVEKFIKEFIKKITDGKIDDKLIYRKSIRKELGKYIKTTPPHVKAARLLDNLDSNVIQYYITTAGPEPIQKRKHKINYAHYIEKQIAPIADQILTLLGKNFEDIVKNSRQKTLL